MDQTKITPEDLTISIIVPGYNDEAYIQRALQSSMKQTHPKVQIIAVDDGSTDDTLAKMNELASNNEHLTVVSLPKNQGAHNARRAGLEKATGDLVIFLDGDDELSPEACAIAAREFVQAPYDVLHFNTRVQSDGAIPFGRLRAIQRWMGPAFGELYDKDIVDESFISHNYTYSIACKVYPLPLVRQAFAALGDIWCDAGEDAMEYFAVASRAQIYRGLPLVYGYVYHLGDGGSEHSNLDEEGYARTLRLRSSVDAMEKYAEQNGLREKYAEALDFHHNDQAYMAVKIWVEDVDPQAKEVCLRDLLKVWPEDQVVDLLCEYGTPVMEVACKVLGTDYHFTDDQLKAWGFADGEREARDEFQESPLYALDKARRVLARKIRTVLSLAGIGE